MMAAHKLTGWRRLGIVLSVLWVLGVGVKAFNDYRKVSKAGDPMGGFVTLKDSGTGRQYGQLSKVGVLMLLNDERLAAMSAAITIQENDTLVRQMQAAAKVGGIVVKDATPGDKPGRMPAGPVDEFQAAVNRVDTTLHVGDLILTLTLPPVFLCAAFFVVGWVVAGFNKANSHS